jgi:acetate kinase
LNFVLCINPGSTNTKYTLFRNGKKVFSDKFENKNSLRELHKTLKQKNLLNSLRDISRIGIRIVHGGTIFKKPTILGPKNMKALRGLSELAPIHNPPAIKIIDEIRRAGLKCKIIGVFDTAFHQTIPDFASTYAIPQKLSKKFHIKKYGFHGIACANALRQVKAKIKKLPENIVICHLGGGCSVTAVKNGKSVDTSMGFTPLEGLMMVTRAGDIDPGIIGHLAGNLGLSVGKIIDILNYKSGIYGITGKNDVKMVVDNSGSGECKLAIDMFVHRLIKYIYAYYGILQGLDLIIFSGGIGHGSSIIRKKVVDKLAPIGFKLDNKKNATVRFDAVSVSAPRSKPVFVVDVHENGEIFREMV